MSDGRITLQVPLSPETALARLDAFGRDWRESKMPAELRKQLAFGATVDFQGARFALRPTSGKWVGGLRLVGSVVAHADGSIVRGQITIAPSWGYWVGWALLGAFVLYWVVAAGLYRDVRGIAEGLFTGVFAVIAHVTLVWLQVQKAVPQFELLLDRALTWTGAAT